MQVYVDGIGILGPGFAGWPVSRAVLAGEAPWLGGETQEPSAAILPPNERRRSSALVRWAMHVAEEALRHADQDPRALPTVFASSGGETGVLDEICRSLASSERVLSPTLFHHSVHNAAAGYWGIATGAQRSSTSLSCYDSSFGSGLLEAAAYAEVEQAPVLLVAYDLPPPPALFPARPLTAGFAVALVLCDRPSGRNLARLKLHLEDVPGGAPDTLGDPRIEALRCGNPAARALPLLTAIARRRQTGVRLDYFEEQCLSIEVSPCPP